MNLYMKHLSKYNYDIRKSKDARWIDQKCTFDVICIVADCILEFCKNNDEFTVSDIWHSEYARLNVISIFSKPDTENTTVKNEYDKYFSQPIKLLAYSKILSYRKSKNKFTYWINDYELLTQIALKPMNALLFLNEYIQKVLKDSEIINFFDNFLNKQDVNSFKILKDNFIKFTIENTKINTNVEASRIFTKILNPLAFWQAKKGTEKGLLSKNNITLNDIQYNRFNFKDKVNKKDKNVSRQEFSLICEQLNNIFLDNYSLNKAKKFLRKYNELFNNNKSEIKQQSEIVDATQVHHIFPVSRFPIIRNYLENLICLTPNQHYSYAHPSNNTWLVDNDFQYICLLAKTIQIYESIVIRKDNFYSFEDFIFVLNTGLKTSVFNEIKILDFTELINKIDLLYLKYIENNKYSELIQLNKLKLISEL
ncbi:restriction endonuclease [Mycoplasmopsis caviae]|uniref:Restriction endonuclease n=1 Tax=Mycoplasmopsis caviae TaxID=55603 RepID=A0A3P8LB95_9BACT|nr:restriction endonuclease [Mycoplasmopsis caviae]UUD34847.1 restriction endonuclease [Mycoplasmopsis caviae]VDR42301.1 Uncharacterised protein [Mycoplasmopsis caviae]